MTTFYIANKQLITASLLDFFLRPRVYPLCLHLPIISSSFYIQPIQNPLPYGYSHSADSTK
uniref:Uncharacterized protein n=1 Tax=Solanum lycopersicum TaxID=4081 RepID=A0A3Q7HJS8_SOLLC